MKTFSLSGQFRRIFTTLCFAIISTSPLLAQTSKTAPAASNARIAFINSLAFEDSQTGIKKLTTVLRTLESEFKTKQDELLTMQKKADALEKEARTLSGQSSSAKYEQAEKLRKDVKFKFDALQTQFNKRRDELTSPLYTSLGNTLKQWCKQKGYNMVVDISRDDKGMFFVVDESIITATTAEFIQYYNSLP